MHMSIPHSHNKMVLQVGLYCPKIAIMMEGWATDSTPAQFEVAAQELSAKFQSGVHTTHHSQPGPGPVSLQVLLAPQHPSIVLTYLHVMLLRLCVTGTLNV